MFTVSKLPQTTLWHLCTAISCYLSAHAYANTNISPISSCRLMYHSISSLQATLACDCISRKQSSISSCFIWTTSSKNLNGFTWFFMALLFFYQQQTNIGFLLFPLLCLYLPLSCSPTVPSTLRTGERRRKCAITSSVPLSTEITWLLTSWNRRSSTSWPISTERGGQCHRGEQKMRGTACQIVLRDIFRLPLHRMSFDKRHYAGRVLT